MKRITSAALALLLLSLLLSALPAALAQEPEAVQNAALWVRADAGVSTDAEGKLTQWADQSGNGHNGTPLNGAKTPVLVKDSIGGKPALQFAGGDQIIDFGQPLPESWDRSAYSVFFVYRPRIVKNGGYHFIGADDWGYGYIRAMAGKLLGVPQFYCATADGLDTLGADVGAILARAQVRARDIAAEITRFFI